MPLFCNTNAWYVLFEKFSVRYIVFKPPLNLRHTFLLSLGNTIVRLVHNGLPFPKRADGITYMTLARILVTPFILIRQAVFIHQSSLVQNYYYFYY